MLTIEQIADYFPPNFFKKFPKNALVEYLQHELLDSIFKHKDSVLLSFIGGTAIRVLYQNQRFSEDIDFDNFGLSFEQFEQLLQNSCRDMEYKGFIIEFKMIERGAYHCYIRFPKILYQTGISRDLNRKILIRIDSETKKKLYESQLFLLNRFAVYRQILAAPAPILLSQKMMTVLQRKREKGRDVFDVSFLSGLTEPNFQYIKKTIGIEKNEFLSLFSKRIDELDLKFLANDVEPFLFSPDLKVRVLTFREYWNQLSNKFRNE